jgi:hypothetical protein
MTVTAAVWTMFTVELAVAVTVLVPASVELIVPVICPLVPVVPEGWVKLIPGSTDARVTVAPLTRLSKASRTVTVIVERLAPLLAVIGVGAAVIEDRGALGPAGVPVAVNATWFPTVPIAGAVAVTVFGPAVVLRVQDITVTIPSPPVAIGVVGFTVPLFTPVANVTWTPATALPLASLTITEGGEATAVPAVADWVVGLLFAMDAAAPAVSAIVPDTTLVSPVAPKLSV